MNRFIDFNKFAAVVLIWIISFPISVLCWTTDVNNGIRYFWTSVLVFGVLGIAGWKYKQK